MRCATGRDDHRMTSPCLSGRGEVEPALDIAAPTLGPRGLRLVDRAFLTFCGVCRLVMPSSASASITPLVIVVTLDDAAPCKTNPRGSEGCGESGAIGR